MNVVGKVKEGESGRHKQYITILGDVIIRKDRWNVIMELLKNKTIPP